MTVAEEDFEVKDSILKILSKHYFSLYKSINSKMPINIGNAGVYGFDLLTVSEKLLIPYYLIHLIHGSTQIPAYSDLVDDVERSLSVVLRESMEFEADIENRKKEFGPFLKKCKKLFSTINSCDDMFKLYYSTFIEAKISDDIISIMSLNLSTFINNLLCKIEINAPLITSGIQIDRELQEYIFMQIALFAENNNAALCIPEKDIAIFYFFGMTMITLMEEYKKAKEFYNQNNQENVFQDFEITMQEYKETKIRYQNLEKENISLQSKCAELASLINITAKEKENIYASTIREQEKEITKLKQLLLIENEKNIELNTLREFVFSYKPDDFFAVPKDSNIKIIREKKIVVIGGSDNWQKKIKGTYPEFKVISGFSVTFDLNILRSADFVFLNVIDMSHAAYLRIIEFIRKHNIRYWYVNSTSMEKFHKEIVAMINDKYKC